jgi:hypothetical protein
MVLPRVREILSGSMNGVGSVGREASCICLSIRACQACAEIAAELQFEQFQMKS